MTACWVSNARVRGDVSRGVRIRWGSWADTWPLGLYSGSNTPIWDWRLGLSHPHHSAGVAAAWGEGREPRHLQTRLLRLASRGTIAGAMAAGAAHAMGRHRE